MKRSYQRVRDLIAGLGFSVVISSCAEESDTAHVLGPPNLQPVHFISTAGTTHNNALAAVLTELQATAASQGTLSESQVFAVIREALNDYFAITISDALWNQGVSAANTAHNEDRPNWTNYVSAQAAEYLQDVTDLLELQGISSAEVIPALEDIEEAAVAALSGSDETKVLDYISVAAASTQYWEANHDEWDDVMCDLGHCGIAASTSHGSGWRILASDVFGALIAGIWGAAIGSTISFIYEFG